MVMEELKIDITIENGEKVIGLDSRDVSRGFPFSNFPLAKLVVVSDFGQEQNA